MKTHTETEAEKRRRGLKTEIYSLASKHSENYFSNQGANILISSFLSRNFQNLARRNFQVEAV